jgi:hypothetical protein
MVKAMSRRFGPVAISRLVTPWLLSLVAVAAVAACKRSEAPPKGETAAEPKASASLFGVPLSGKSPNEALRAVIEAPAAFEGKVVTVEGKVRKACSRKGCWMELAPSLDEKDPGCRVTFKDYGFFVPTDSAGSTATVEGLVQVKRVPQSRVTHLEAEGATFPQKNPDGSANELQLVATGVELVR